MAHLVTLLFDVEDPFQPQVNAIATTLTKLGVQATFLISATPAHSQNTSPANTVTALREHHIGLLPDHSPTHSTAAEYLADLSWNNGVWAAYDNEGTGIETIAETFGVSPNCIGQPNGSWGPQLNAALQKLNIPAIIYPPTRTEATADLHWYAGSLVFPDKAISFFKDAFSNDRRFEADMAHMHTRLDKRINNGNRWTGLNIQLSPPQSPSAHQTTLPNLTRLITDLTRDRRLQIRTIAQVKQLFSPPPETIFLPEIDRAVWQATHYDDIPTDFYAFSAAELLDMLIRIYSDFDPHRESIRRRDVLGPTEEPTPFDPAEEPLYWSDFVAACRMADNFITNSGQLPATVFLRGSEWSIGAFFRAAINAWPQFRADKPPNYIEWQPAYMYPAIGHTIAAAVQTSYQNRPDHAPEIDTNTLLMHTCFQCWTLRPAY